MNKCGKVLTASFLPDTVESPLVVLDTSVSLGLAVAAMVVEQPEAAEVTKAHLLGFRCTAMYK